MMNPTQAFEKHAIEALGAYSQWRKEQGHPLACSHVATYEPMNQDAITVVFDVGGRHVIVTASGLELCKNDECGIQHLAHERVRAATRLN